jgi:hypothetical protein
MRLSRGYNAGEVIYVHRLGVVSTITRLYLLRWPYGWVTRIAEFEYSGPSGAVIRDARAMAAPAHQILVRCYAIRKTGTL